MCRLSTAATIAVRDVERGMARELVEVARVDGRDRRSRLRPAHNTSSDVLATRKSAERAQTERRRRSENKAKQPETVYRSRRCATVRSQVTSTSTAAAEATGEAHPPRSVDNAIDAIWAATVASARSSTFRERAAILSDRRCRGEAIATRIHARAR